MAYLADRKFDVFVSYAHIDNEEKRWRGGGRIQGFMQQLATATHQRLGKPISYFLAIESLPLEGKWQNEIQAAMEGAAVLLMFLSPAYVRSEWAQRERSAFRATNTDPSRIIVIELWPLPEELSDEFESLSRIKLWYPASDRTPEPLLPESGRYDAAVEDAAARLAEVLNSLAASAKGTGEALDADPAISSAGRPADAPKRKGKDTGDGHEARVQSDRYRTQTDRPTRLDALEREPFAVVLARRIREARVSEGSPRAGDDRAFMVHLHGPWGSGKSSMLLLLEQQLEATAPGSPGSLVVWFNAWKHQRRRPPWWTLLTTIYNAAIQKCDLIADKSKRNRERRALRWLWWRWRLRADLLPGVLVAGLLALIAFTFVNGTTDGSSETVLKIMLPAITAAATLIAYARLIAFGSDKAAKTYLDLSTDPYSPVVGLFRQLVGRLSRPLVVFIEDLDRCDSEYVVELLEGIQTLFREQPVTYVIAADRKWICTSFDKKYVDFGGSIGGPCRPLGYLFIDKIFQVSAGVPRLNPQLQARYLAALLREGEPPSTTPDAAAIEAATSRVQGLTDEHAIQKAIEERASGTIAEQRAIRSAAALQITSAEAMGRTENRLQKLAHLLEPNPRAMKQLVNAVGMAQALGILEGRVITPEARARWAMLSLRWPVFADFIADNPEALRHWIKAKRAEGSTGATPEPDPTWPKPVQEIFGNKAVKDIVGGADEEGALTPAILAAILD